MDNVDTARTALAFMMSTLKDAGKISSTTYTEAMSLIDVLYSPYFRAKNKASFTSVKATFLGVPAVTTPSPPAPEPTLALASLPATPRGWPQQFPPNLYPGSETWRPVMHANGPNPCGQPAYYVLNKFSRYTKPDLNNMRMLHSGKPPVVGLDHMVCGTCRQEIDPFKSYDLDLLPHFFTDDEEIRQRQPTIRTFSADPVIDPRLEEQNNKSNRWEANESDALTGLLTTAQALIHSDDLTLPEVHDQGLPGVDPNDLPDFEFDVEIDNPAGQG